MTWYYLFQNVILISTAIFFYHYGIDVKCFSKFKFKKKHPSKYCHFLIGGVFI